MAIALPALHRLPRQVKPFPGETIASYLARLAHANQLDAKALRCYLTGDRHSSLPMPADRLSQAAGYPARALQHAIPDLGVDRRVPTLGHNGSGIPQRKDDDGPACQLCVLARGIGLPVRCWKHPENLICLRHRRWTGLPADGDQPDLSRQPDIIQAHRRHLRLARRFGRDAVAHAFAAADHICRRWHKQGRHDGGFRQRMGAFDNAGHPTPPTRSAVAAATYPQSVALTRLLVSPYWQSLARPGNPAAQERFIDEVRKTAAPGYPWPQLFNSTDPLHRWITEHRLVSPSPALLCYHSWPAPVADYRCD